MTVDSTPEQQKDPGAVSERGTVYVIATSRWKSGDVGGSLLLDSGRVPWGHLSSGIGWLARDLTNGFHDRASQLAAWYPNGYDVVVVDVDDDYEALVPAEVRERNKAYADESEVTADA